MQFKCIELRKCTTKWEVSITYSIDRYGKLSYQISKTFDPQGSYDKRYKYTTNKITFVAYI